MDGPWTAILRPTGVPVGISSSKIASLVIFPGRPVATVPHAERDTMAMRRMATMGWLAHSIIRKLNLLLQPVIADRPKSTFRCWAELIDKTSLFPI